MSKVQVIKALTELGYVFVCSGCIWVWLRKVYGKYLDKHTEKLRKKNIEALRKLKVKPKKIKELLEPDFLSEEDLEAQGIPSSCFMDLEDLEEEEA